MRRDAQFTALAEYYDMLNSADYGKYADYVQRVMEKYGENSAAVTVGERSPFLDLGCGTGALTLELSRRGLDMIGADISPEMLNVAMRNACEAEQNILYIRQDMRSFELYGTVCGAVCALDGINYLQSEEDILRCMRLVRNYLDPGALFMFDVNTPWRFENEFARRDIFTHDGNGEVYMGWRSELHRKSGVCDFDITLFIRNEDGTYSRRKERQREHLWTMEQLKNAVMLAGLETVEVFRDLDMNRAEESEGETKWYFVCRCPIDKA